MSTLVLHMSKFKKDAIRGIQSHNRRERESHSNPDIDYSRSVGNYDLHESASDNYAQAIQNRIDDLLMVKVFRGSRSLSHGFCRQGKRHLGNGAYG